MKTVPLIDRIKERMKSGIGLAGKKFKAVDEVTLRQPFVYFARWQCDEPFVHPELNAHRLPVLRVFTTLEALLDDRWDERYVRGAIYAIEPEVLLRPPSDCESNPAAYWKVLPKEQHTFFGHELAEYYPVDDRPSVSPEHKLRVFHVDVSSDRQLELPYRRGKLSTGLWEVVVDRQKRPQEEAPGCTVVTVRGLERSSLVEAQRTLSGLNPSLEGYPPSLLWE